MKFMIFKKTGEIHFEHNGMDDYDGDDGHNIEIEVDDEQVRRDVVKMILDDYIINKEFVAIINSAYNSLLNGLYKFIDDLDYCLGSLIDLWKFLISEHWHYLRDKYEKEYNN